MDEKEAKSLKEKLIKDIEAREEGLQQVIKETEALAAEIENAEMYKRMLKYVACQLHGLEDLSESNKNIVSKICNDIESLESGSIPSQLTDAEWNRSPAE